MRHMAVRKSLVALLGIAVLCMPSAACTAVLVSVSPLKPVVGQPVLVTFDLTDEDRVYGFRRYVYGSRVVAFLLLDDTVNPPQGIRRVTYPIDGLLPGSYTLEVYLSAPASRLLFNGNVEVLAAHQVPGPSPSAHGILVLGILIVGLTWRSSRLPGSSFHLAVLPRPAAVQRGIR